MGPPTHRLAGKDESRQMATLLRNPSAPGAPGPEEFRSILESGGLENRIIEPEFGSAAEGEVGCRERLGGLLRYYYHYRDAA